MIEDPRPLVFALAKLHPARNTAAALFHLKHRQPPPQTPNNWPSPLPGFDVINNDGEPNDGL